MLGNGIIEVPYRHLFEFAESLHKAPRNSEKLGSHKTVAEGSSPPG
jgi:hypothetical protein